MTTEVVRHRHGRRHGNRGGGVIDGFRLDTDPDPETGSGFRIRVRVRVRVRVRGRGAFFLAAVEMGFAERLSVDYAAFAAPISAVGSLAAEIVR